MQSNNSNNKSEPLVTIGALNYNNERFVIETLESIKSQTYANIELVIVDDCSTDSSLELIKDWLNTYNKPYNLIIHSANKGITYGVDQIINSANGKYISLVATDDVLLAHKVEDQIKILEANPDYAMVYGDFLEIDEQSIVIEDESNSMKGWREKSFIPPSGNIFQEVIKGVFFLNQTALINLSMLKKTEFKFDRDVMADDWDLQLTLSRNYKIIASPVIWTKYRRTSTSFSAQYMEPQNIHKPYKSAIYLLMKYYNHHLNTHQDKKVILDKVSEIYCRLEMAKVFTRMDIIDYNVLLFKKTGSLKNLFLAFRTSVAHFIGREFRRVADVDA